MIDIQGVGRMNEGERVKEQSNFSLVAFFFALEQFFALEILYICVHFVYICISGDLY